MKLERKVILQAKTINRLQEENESLKAQLEYQKQIVNDYSNKIKDAEKTKEEYEKLIKELKENKQNYKEKNEVLKKTIKKRNKKIDDVLRLINKFDI